jgi:hypothetical protein
MADNQSIKLLDRQIVTDGYHTAPVDLGAYGALQVQIRVHEAGGGTIYMAHSAVNEPLSFLQLGDTVSLSATEEDGDLQSHTNFLRFIRCKTSSVTGTPIISIDVVAKEH